MRCHYDAACRVGSHKAIWMVCLLINRKGRKQVRKMSFRNNVGLFVSVWEKSLDKLKSKLFPIKNQYKIPTTEPTSEPTLNSTLKPKAFDTSKPTKAKTQNFPLKLCQKFVNEQKRYKWRKILILF